MGGQMVERLLGGGHSVVVYDKSPEPVKKLEGQGAIGSNSLADMIKKLDKPKNCLVHGPLGRYITLQTIRAVAAELSAGDIIIDGGNSFYKDSKTYGRRAF